MNNGYTPRPVDTSRVAIPTEVMPLIDSIAEHNHDVWAAARMREGWRYGESANSSDKRNPLLKPYSALTREEKQAALDSPTEIIRQLLAMGYTITKDEETAVKKKTEGKQKNNSAQTFDTLRRDYLARACNQGRTHSEPEYRVPLIIGLVGQDLPYDEKKLHSALSRFVDSIFADFKISHSKHNSERSTPVYALSACSCRSEIAAAQYLASVCKIPTIEVSQGSAPSGNMKVYCTGDVHRYIVDNSFGLLALWDGTTTSCKCADAVRMALIESDSGADIPDGAHLEINTTHPVFQIVLPSNSKRSQDHSYMTRRMLPYILESGTRWYTLERAVVRGDVLVSDTDILKRKRRQMLGKAIRLKKRSMRHELKNAASYVESDIPGAERRRKIRATRRKIRELYLGKWKSVSPAFKFIKRRQGGHVGNIRAQFSYAASIEESKTERYLGNAKMLGRLNDRSAGTRKYISNDSAWPLLVDGIVDCRGCSRSADASELRHIFYDKTALHLQKTHQMQSRLLAIFVAIGLCAYSIFSDLAGVHSPVGIIGAVLSALFIAASLVIFFWQRASRNHGGYIRMRVLAEGLRVKTFWNAAGLVDNCVGDYYASRQAHDIEWATLTFHAWDTLDRAQGFYDETGMNAPVLDNVMRLWIGNETDGLEPIGEGFIKYKPVNDGKQMAYMRKSSRRHSNGARIQSGIQNGASILVVLFTIAITLFSSIYFISEVGIPHFTGTFMSNLENLYTIDGMLGIFETVAIFIIGILPAIAACLVMYNETKMHTYNTKRYKWSALQYQKILTWYSRPNIGNDVRRRLFEMAGRCAIEECSEWTLVAVDNDVTLPF